MTIAKWYIERIENGWILDGAFFFSDANELSNYLREMFTPYDEQTEAKYKKVSERKPE